MNPKQRRFANRVAIVTGSTSGIGLATAMRLGDEGAHVVIAAPVREQVSSAASRIRQECGAEVLECVCDVSKESDVVATVRATLKAYGRLDVVVNNAGVMVFKPLQEHTQEDWLKLLHVDLLGAFFFIKQAFLEMKSGGAIVNVSSIHAEETTPLVAAYAAAKAATNSLTRSASIEGKPKGIRVNGVMPGAVNTPMLRENPNIRSGVETLDPAFIGQPEDVASAVAYLASDDAAFIQGAVVKVDGGRLARL